MKGPYPSEKDLSDIECWAFHGVLELFEFIKSIWTYPETIEEVEKGEYKYIIFGTGGWSGNEAILSALKSNFACWSWCWYCSFANGTHCFRVKQEPNCFLAEA